MPKSRSRLVLLAVAVLAPAALFALVYPLAWRVSRSSATQNVVMADRELLVTAAELLEAIGRDDVTLDPRDETVRKERLPRGGRQLSYRHVSSKVALEIEAQVTAELDELDAKATFAQLEPRLAAPGASVELQAAPVSWGDEQRYAALTRGGTLVGHAFLARKGTQVVFYRVVGVAFPDPKQLEAHLQPRLAAVERFTP